jgi:hypothetical protein
MKNMNLTSEEQDVAAKWITQLEKRGRQWNTVRWCIIVIYTILLVGVLLLGRLNDSFSSSLGVSPRITSTTFDAKHVQKAIDCAVGDYAARECAYQLRLLLDLCFGLSATVLAYFFFNRERGVRATLMASLLREGLERSDSLGKAIDSDQAKRDVT